LNQFTNLPQEIANTPYATMVDLGFKGVDDDNPGVEIIHRGKFKKLSNQQRNWLRRRSAVDPTIGHLKDIHGVQRCCHITRLGDAVLVAIDDTKDTFNYS
jgi:IS5 family transposase